MVGGWGGEGVGSDGFRNGGGVRWRLGGAGVGVLSRKEFAAMWISAGQITSE